MNEPMTFEEFAKDWRQRHKGSIPRQQRISSWGLIAGIALWLFIATLAAIFSGTHTVPTAALTILKSIESPYREYLSLTVFAVLELAIFAGSLYRRGNHVALTIMVLAFIGALFANVGSSVFAVTENSGDVLIMITAIILAVLAPSVALGAGEMFHRLYQEHQAKIELANADYKARLKEQDAIINREFTKTVNARETARENSRTFTKSDEPQIVHETSRNPAKPRVKIHEVAKLIHENGDIKLSVNEMMEKYQISSGSTSKVRDILASQNGHTAHEGGE